MAFARVVGFCGGHVVGEAESRNGGAPVPHWWPGGEPAPVTHPAQKRISARRATGAVIAGFWSRSGGGFGGACGWHLAGGELEALDLHPGKAWDNTIAMGSGGGAFAGSGERKVKKGERAVDVALFWRPDGTMIALPPAEAGNAAMAEGTDGAWVVGRVGRTGGQRAALWPADGSQLIVLGDERSITEACAVADGEQVGVRWTNKGVAAALWRGDAASFVNLTPENHQSGWARDCAHGFQVGHVQVKDTLRSGSSSMATKAALWRGSATSFVDLQAMAPAPWNASTASALEVRGGVLRIAGDVTQFGTTDELTPRESHYLITSRPVLWETRID